MAKKKIINERCPFHDECERTKCEHIHSESGCDYYHANARPGAEIADQNTIPYPDILDEADEPMTSELVYLPIDSLFPHPDNPRKDLGDLTELADSIKANGVMQNLTVVPFKSKTNPNFNGEGKYTIVIGHRRHAAAEIAGLTMLPCIITEMSYEDQIATMMLENMQRSDLTVYEQAKGMQTMLDLGVSVEQIAEKTGFSKTTVRRRVKLLDLDEREFEKSVGRGATLFEYAELDKLKDLELKNKVLKYIGTDNFKNELKKAIDFEKDKEYLDTVETEVSKFASKVDEKRENFKYVGDYSTWSKREVIPPDDCSEVEYFYTRSDRYVSLYVEDIETTEDIERKIKEERIAEEKRNRKAGLQDASARAYELRKDAFDNVPTSVLKKNTSHLLEYVLKIKFLDNYGFFGRNDILNIVEVGTDEKEQLEKTNDLESVVFKKIEDLTHFSPEKTLLKIALYFIKDEKGRDYYDWDADHVGNKRLDLTYELLNALGYGMSDEEKALQDGTHELFKREESEESE